MEFFCGILGSRKETTGYGTCGILGHVKTISLFPSVKAVFFPFDIKPNVQVKLKLVGNTWVIEGGFQSQGKWTAAPQA